MATSKCYIIITVLCSLILSICTDADLASKKMGAYLGETSPETVAKLFAPGIVTTGFHTRDIAISPDGNEIYFCLYIGNNTFMTTLFTQCINDEWTEPQIASFARDLKYLTLEP